MWCSASALAQSAAPPESAPAAPAPDAASTPATASAPTADDAQRTAIARALFEEGLRFVDLGAWQDAADRFSRVLAIRYSTVAAYNFAVAQARLGKLITAQETLRKLLGDGTLEPKVRDPALALQAEIHGKLGWLTVHVEGADNSCTLLVDAHAWPQAAWGIAAPIDPGEHTIELQRGAQQLRSARVTIAAGARVEETLSLISATAPAAVAANAGQRDPASAPPGALSASDDGGEKRSVFRSPWFWGGVGAVVIAGAATAIVIAASGGSDPATPVKGDFMPGVIEGRVP